MADASDPTDVRHAMDRLREALLRDDDAVSDFRESFCDTCGDRICWCVTERSKRMPVDWEGDVAGEFMVVHNDMRVGGDTRVPLVLHRTKLDRAKGHRLMRRGPRKSQDTEYWKGRRRG